MSKEYMYRSNRDFLITTRIHQYPLLGMFKHINPYVIEYFSTSISGPQVECIVRHGIYVNHFVGPIVVEHIITGPLVVEYITTIGQLVVGYVRTAPLEVGYVRTEPLVVV